MEKKMDKTSEAVINSFLLGPIKLSAIVEMFSLSALHDSSQSPSVATNHSTCGQFTGRTECLTWISVNFNNYMWLVAILLGAQL